MTSAPHIPEPVRRALVALALLALWAGAAWFKAERVAGNPDFSARDDTAMFWGTDALRYRYAKMLATGIEIPEQDTAVLWPRGVSTRAEDARIMEKLAAASYRTVAAAGCPASFHAFLVWWASAMSALAVWPVYLLSRRLWHRRPAGLASVVLWATAYGGLHASNLPRFSAADFAQPWLFLTVYLALTAVTENTPRRIARGLLAAGCCWWTLTLWPSASWMLLLVMVIAAAIDYHHLAIDLVTEPEPTRTPRTLQGRALYEPAILVGLAMVGAGLTVPSLTARGTAWSLPVIFGGAWVVLGFLLRRVELPLPAGWRLLGDTARLMPRAFRWRRRLAPMALWLLASGLLVALAVATRWFTRSKLADYPVLLNLVLAKLVNFGQIPIVPHALEDDVRWLWTQSFLGPEVTTLWLSALGLLLLTPLAMVLPFIQMRHQAGAAAIASGARLVVPFGRVVMIGLTGVLAFFWVLASDLDGWFVWAASVTAGSLVDVALNVGRYPPLWRLGARPKIIAAFLLAGAVAANVVGLLKFTGGNDRPPPGFVLALIKQVRSLAEPDAALAAPAMLGSTLLAATGRPILVHDDVLNRGNRARLAAFSEALFGSEADLAAFCRQHGARYVVVAAATMLELAPGQWRYDSNHLMVRRDCAAYRLHFEPETLTRFRLIYTGPLYRLFKVGERWQPSPLGDARYLTWNRAGFSDDRLRLLPR
ncbi:MAG: hypothetical protein HZA91_13235 [Verrucomicrobia bacterium]|nr:hypothetical protein [Verrucomicrobiota bacterium]